MSKVKYVCSFIKTLDFKAFATQDFVKTKKTKGFEPKCRYVSFTILILHSFIFKAQF